MIAFGQPRMHFAECSSTNDAARTWALSARDPASSGALVTADFQTSGRGQRGHQWQAEAGQSALMSFVYRLSPQTESGLLGLMTAVAVTDALATLNFSAKIKWPNDILIDGRKVGGILVEISAGAAVLGIGINVKQEKFNGGSEFAYPPTSLRLVSGREQSVESVIEAVGHCLALGEERLGRNKALILDGCRERLAKGARVHQGDVYGELVGLTERGAAVVCLPDGTFAEWTTVN